MIVTKCRSCQAEIFFAKTKNGVSMPLDARPNPDGNVVLVGDTAHVLRTRDLYEAAEVTPETPPNGLRYMPHHATCPQAAKHRKGK